MENWKQRDSVESKGYTDETGLWIPYQQPSPLYVWQNVPLTTVTMSTTQDLHHLAPIGPSRGGKATDKGRYHHMGNRPTSRPGKQGTQYSQSPGLDLTENPINNIQNRHFQEAHLGTQLNLQTTNPSMDVKSTSYMTTNPSLDVRSTSYMTTNASSDVKSTSYATPNASFNEMNESLICESREPTARPPETDNVVNLGAKAMNSPKETDESKDVQEAEEAKPTSDQMPYQSLSEDRSPYINIRECLTKTSNEIEKIKAEGDLDSRNATEPNDDNDDDGNVGRECQSQQKSNDAESVTTDLVKPQQKVKEKSDLEVGSHVVFKGQDGGYHHHGLVAEDCKDKEKRGEKADIRSECERSGNKRGSHADVSVQVKEPPDRGQDVKEEKYVDSTVTGEEMISEKCEMSGDKRGSHVDVNLEVNEPSNSGQDVKEEKNTDVDITDEEKKISEKCEMSGDKRERHADFSLEVMEPLDRSHDVKEKKDAVVEFTDEEKKISEKCEMSGDKRGSHVDVNLEVMEPPDRGQDVKEKKDAVVDFTDEEKIYEKCERSGDKRGSHADVLRSRSHPLMAKTTKKRNMQMIMSQVKKRRSLKSVSGQVIEGRRDDISLEIKELPIRGQNYKEEKDEEDDVTGTEKISETSPGEEVHLDKDGLPDQGVGQSQTHKWEEDQRLFPKGSLGETLCHKRSTLRDRIVAEIKVIQAMLKELDMTTFNFYNLPRKEQVSRRTVIVSGESSSGKSTALSGLLGEDSNVAPLGVGACSFVLLGPVGAGKSSFINSMIGVGTVETSNRTERLRPGRNHIDTSGNSRFERMFQPFLIDTSDLVDQLLIKDELADPHVPFWFTEEAILASRAATAQPMSECSKTGNIIGSGQNDKTLKHRTQGGHLNSVRQVNVKRTLKGEGEKTCDSVRDSDSVVTLVLRNIQYAIECVPDSSCKLFVFNLFLQDDDEDVILDITADENATCSQSTRDSFSTELDLCGVEDGETCERKVLLESFTESDEIVFKADVHSEKASDECNFDALESSKKDCRSKPTLAPEARKFEIKSNVSALNQHENCLWHSSSCFKPPTWEDFVHSGQASPRKIRTHVSLGWLWLSVTMILLLLSSAGASTLHHETRAHVKVPGMVWKEFFDISVEILEQDVRGMMEIENFFGIMWILDSLTMQETQMIAEEEALELDCPSECLWCGKFETEWDMIDIYMRKGDGLECVQQTGKEMSLNRKEGEWTGSDLTDQQFKDGILDKTVSGAHVLAIRVRFMAVLLMLWILHSPRSGSGICKVGSAHCSRCKEENRVENDATPSETFESIDDLGPFEIDKIRDDTVQNHAGEIRNEATQSELESKNDKKLCRESGSDFPLNEKRKVEDTDAIKDEIFKTGNDVSQNDENETAQSIDSHEEMPQSNGQELKEETYESIQPRLHMPSYINWFERVMNVDTQEDKENLMTFLYVLLDSFDKLPVEMKTKSVYGPRQRKQTYPRGAPYGVHKKRMSRKQKEAAIAEQQIGNDKEQYHDLHPLVGCEKSQVIRRLLKFSQSIPDVRKCQQALIKTFSNDTFMRREVMRCMRMSPRMRNFELLKLLVFRLQAPSIDVIERNLRTFVCEPVYNGILQLMHSGHRKHGHFRKHHHNKPLCKNSDRRKKQEKVNYLYDNILKEDEFVSEKGSRANPEGFKEITCSKDSQVRLAEVLKVLKLKEKSCNVDGCMVSENSNETDLYETHAFIDDGRTETVASSHSSSIDTKAIRSSYEWIFVPRKSHRKDSEKFGSCVPSVDDLTVGVEGQTAEADATEVKLKGLPDESDLLTILDDIPTIPKACPEEDQGTLVSISLPEKSKTVEKTDQKFENSDSEADDGEERLLLQQQDMLPMPVSVPSAAAAAAAAAQEQPDIPLKVKVIQPRQSLNDEQIDQLSRLCLNNLAPVKGLKRREKKDAFTDDDLKGIIRNHTWLPLDKLPPPRLDLTNAVVANITTAGLDAIFKQIALGNTPGPATTMKFELLRLCTLRNYPKRNKPYLIRLAASGFYFAADGDEVVCYCCGIRRNGWNERDVPDEIHKRLSPKCSFFSRNAQVNYPVPRRVDGEVNKFAFLEEFVAPNLDEEGEDVTNDFTGPARLQQMQRNGQPPVVTNGSRMTSSLGITTEQPKHPHYAVKSVRLNSYVGWPESSNQEPAVLAEAGFYFAGIGDCVRCFFCGVGLRHWAAEDNPWIEHARWSQTCSYLRQYKGEEFINLVHMAIQITRDEEPSAPGTQPNEETTKVLMTDAAQSVLEMGYDPRIIRKAIDSILRDTGRSGVTAQRIMEKVLEIEEQENAEEPSREMQQLSLNRQDSTSTTTPSTTGVSHAQANQGAPGAQGAGTGAQGRGTGKPNKQAGQAGNGSGSLSKDKSGKSTGTGAPGQDPKRIKEENEKMKEQTVCKICMDRTVCIVFLPCGHLVTCAECAPALRKCPICRSLVKGTVKTYMS